MYLLSAIRTLASMSAFIFAGFVPVYFFLVFRRNQTFISLLVQDKIFILFLSFFAGIYTVNVFLIITSLLSINFSFQSVWIFSVVFFVLFIAIILFEVFRRKDLEATVSPEKPDNLNFSRDAGGFKSSGNHDYADYNCTGSGKKNIPGMIQFFLLKNTKAGNIIFIIFYALIFFNFLIVVFFTFLFPVRFWDAISCWSLKAKAFFIDGSIFPFYTGHNYIFSHLSYPLYLPLSQTWIYIWIGEADQTLVKIIFPVFYAGLIYTAYYLLSKKLKKLSAVILAFILSATPIIIDHGYIEYTNLLFGTALLIGVWFLYLFLQEESNLYLKIIKKKRVFYGFEVYGTALTASLFFCIAAQVRSEGMIFLALFIAVLLGTRIRYLFDKIISKTGLVFSFALPSVACIVFLVPWLYLKKKLGLSFISTEWQSLLPGLTGSSGQQEMAGGQAVNLYFDFMESFKNISAEIAYSFSDSTRAFLGSSYGILWISLLTLFALKIKKIFRQFNWVFAVFFYSGLIMVFLSLGLVGEFAWSVDRYLLHIFPLAYFWVLSGLKNQPV